MRKPTAALQLYSEHLAEGLQLSVRRSWIELFGQSKSIKVSQRLRVDSVKVKGFPQNRKIKRRVMRDNYRMAELRLDIAPNRRKRRGLCHILRVNPMNGNVFGIPMRLRVYSKLLRVYDLLP